MAQPYSWRIAIEIGSDVLCITYIRTLRNEEPLRRSDWIKSTGYTVILALVSIAGPNLLGRHKNSPYAFEPRQMGRYDVR